jgi:threonine dehydrogenase-like Zn-dependent dehydrogenase
MDCTVAVITKLHEPLELWTVPIPDLEPGSVLIRVDSATLCGTDAHRWEGHLPPNDRPFVPGHETCGTIVDMRGVVHDILNVPLKNGDRVISSYAHCGHCYYCRVSRQTTLCAQNTNYGAWAPEKLLGGCAEYHVFPVGTSLVRVPDNVPSELAASAACALRTVLHGFEQLGSIESHESVLVLGAGPLGLYATAVARDRGARNVYTIGAPAARVSVATAWGADEIVDMDVMPVFDDRLTWIRERTGGRGADIVLNCASSAAFLDGLQMVRPGGRFVNLGVSGGPDLPVNPDLLFRGVRINTVVMAEARHFFEAIEFLHTRMGKFPFEKLLSNRFPLDRTTDALRGMAAFQEIKPVILPHVRS